MMPHAMHFQAGRMSERELQDALIDRLRKRGWLVYHTWNSRHSEAGFPDLVAVRPPRILFVELKKQAGKLSPAQSDWLDLLRHSLNHEVYVWRPLDWLSGETDAVTE